MIGLLFFYCNFQIKMPVNIRFIKEHLLNFASGFIIKNTI